MRLNGEHIEGKIIIGGEIAGEKKRSKLSKNPVKP